MLCYLYRSSLFVHFTVYTISFNICDSQAHALRGHSSTCPLPKIEAAQTCQGDAPTHSHSSQLSRCTGAPALETATWSLGVLVFDHIPCSTCCGPLYTTSASLAAWSSGQPFIQLPEWLSALCTQTKTHGTLTSTAWEALLTQRSSRSSHPRTHGSPWQGSQLKLMLQVLLRLGAARRLRARLRLPGPPHRPP